MYTSRDLQAWYMYQYMYGDIRFFNRWSGKLPTRKQLRPALCMSAQTSSCNRAHKGRHH